MEDYRRFVKFNGEYYEVTASTLHILSNLFINNKLKKLPLFNAEHKWIEYDLVFHKKTNNFYYTDSKEWYAD